MSTARTPGQRKGRSAPRPRADSHATLAAQIARAAGVPQDAAAIACVLRHAPAVVSAATVFARCTLIAHTLRDNALGVGRRRTRARSLELAAAAEALCQRAARQALVQAALVRGASRRDCSRGCARRQS